LAGSAAVKAPPRPVSRHVAILIPLIPRLFSFQRSARRGGKTVLNLRRFLSIRN
jgi:hypothetical protein